MSETKEYVSEPSVIDERALVQWLESRASKIGDFYVTRNGLKYLLNSPWKPDTKRHLGLFPRRGKYGRFRDYKTGNNGSLIDFVMLIDNVEFKDAKPVLVTADDGWRAPEKPIEEYRPRVQKESGWTLKIPEGCVRITKEHASDDGHIGRACDYLRSRMIDPSKVEVYYCAKDRTMPDGRTQRLKHRVLFPFRDWNGALWYWTARATSRFQQPRYLEPTPSDGSATKEEALYCPSWDIHGHTVLVCEGPIDAMSIWATGIHAVGTQGSNWYQEQQDTLVEFGIGNIVFAFDRDEAGIKALRQAVSMWKGPCYYVFAPKGHDWNSAMKALGVDGLRQHILDNVALVDERTTDMLAWAADTKRSFQPWNASNSRDKSQRRDQPRRTS